MDEDILEPSMQQYQIFHVGGTSGSFINIIFSHYLQHLGVDIDAKKLLVDFTGSCHQVARCPGDKTHWIDKLDSNKKTIAIDFDEDDKKIIATMVFEKIIMFLILKDPTLLQRKWPNSAVSTINWRDRELLKKTFVENPDLLIFYDWKQQLERANPVLILRFKDIMFGDINGIVAKFFQTERLIKLDNFIKEYRKINQKYLDILR